MIPVIIAGAAIGGVVGTLVHKYSRYKQTLVTPEEKDAAYEIADRVFLKANKLYNYGPIPFTEKRIYGTLRNKLRSQSFEIERSRNLKKTELARWIEEVKKIEEQIDLRYNSIG